MADMADTKAAVDTAQERTKAYLPQIQAALDKLKKQHGGDIAAVQEDLAFEFSSALNNVVGIGSGPPVPGAGDDVL